MLRQSVLLASCIVASSMASLISSQSRTAGGPVLYESARLIVGDGSAPIENGAFVVQDGRLTAIGRKDAVSAPRGATRVDLTGKTVMPALVNAHLHIGFLAGVADHRFQHIQYKWIFGLHRGQQNNQKQRAKSDHHQ